MVGSPCPFLERHPALVEYMPPQHFRVLAAPGAAAAGPAPLVPGPAPASWAADVRGRRAHRTSGATGSRKAHATSAHHPLTRRDARNASVASARNTASSSALRGRRSSMAPNSGRGHPSHVAATPKREQAGENLGLLEVEDLGEARLRAARLGKSSSSQGYDRQPGRATCSPISGL